MDTRTIIFAISLAGAVGMSTATRAQAPATPATPPPATAIQSHDGAGENPACAPTKPANPNARPGVTTGQSSGSLSDRLAEGNGVLCPPSGVDPEIRAPTPDVGKTPVIPPPGSPGGDQS